MSTKSISPRDLIEGDIFELLSLNNLTEDQKQETMQKLIDGLNSRVLIHIDDMVKEEDRQDWNIVLQSEDDESIRNFLVQSGVKIDEIVAQEALLMKKELTETIQKMEL